jgi:hypothetical protein
MNEQTKPEKATVEAIDLPLFRHLIHRARSSQNGSLTWNQYMKLVSAFFSAQPPREAGLLIGWAHHHTQRLRAAIHLEGVTIRPEPGWRPKRIPGSATGFGRLGEVENHIQKSAFRREKEALRRAKVAGETVSQ